MRPSIKSEAQYYWRTKDGRKILIKEMEDAHLINTVRLLKRTAPAALDQTICRAWSFYMTLGGEMAQDAMEDEINVLEQMHPEDFLERDYPQWLPLIEELERRGLTD